MYAIRGIANAMVPLTSTAAPATIANAPVAAAQPTAAPAADAKPMAGLPVSDSIPRDPPVGMAFGGSGKYQWYRQGDITWRLDTNSGSACIDFATTEIYLSYKPRAEAARRLAAAFESLPSAPARSEMQR